MSFLDDIRNQPQETREIMFGLAVFITVLLVGMVWFRSFQKNLYSLMNSEEEVEKALAIENAPMPSLFGYMWQAAGDVKGLVSGLFGGEEKNNRTSDPEKVKVESGKIYMLPLSDYK